MVTWEKKKVNELEDGDSGWFADGTPFRLANVRSSESHQFGGSTAKRQLAGMLSRSGNRVSAKTVATDRYGRKVVEMRNSDGSINQRMRMKGNRNKGR